jgi:hypothetical protein
MNDTPDALWPSDNPMGIPSLLLSMQADALDLPLVIWGSITRPKRMRGTWGFYTDDRRFEALWKNPSVLLQTECVTAIEPNFSVYSQTPPAVANWQIYRKRWMARYWQSKGVRVFVDLNVNRAFAEDNLVGVPAGWTAFATRGYAERIDDLCFEYGLAQGVAGKRDGVLFVVYGGGKMVKNFCMDNGLIHVSEQQDGYKTRVAVQKLLTSSVQMGFMFKESSNG